MNQQQLRIVNHFRSDIGIFIEKRWNDVNLCRKVKREREKTKTILVKIHRKSNLLKQNSIDLDEHQLGDVSLENMFIWFLAWLMWKFPFFFLDLWQIDRTDTFVIEIEVYANNSLHLSIFDVLLKWFELKRVHTVMSSSQNSQNFNSFPAPGKRSNNRKEVFDGCILWNRRSHAGFRVVEDRPMSRNDRFDEFLIGNRLPIGWVSSGRT